MAEEENILKSLEYLRLEADAAGHRALSSIIASALDVAGMMQNLKHMEENAGDQQDFLRIMTFINFYKNAHPSVQKQVYAFISGLEN